METSGSEEKCFLTLVWRIKNIVVLEKAYSECIGSPLFRPRTLEGKKLRLLMRPNVKGESLSLLLFQLGDPLDFAIDCEWSFIGPNKSTLVSGKVRNHHSKKYEPLSLPGCPTSEEVFVTKRSAFLPRGDLTVRCRIWKSHGNLSDNEFIFGESRFEKAVQDSFLWTVPGFSSLRLNQEVTTLVKFEFFNESMDFKLKFLLKGSSLEDADVSVELTPISNPVAVVVFIDVQFFEYQQRAKEKIYKKFSQNSEETWIFPEFMSRKKLLKNKSYCMRNDVLTLRCELIAISLCTNNSIQKKRYGYSNLDENISNNASTFLDASCQAAEKFVEQLDISDNSTFLDASCQTSEISVGTLDSSLHRDPLAHLGEDFLSLYREQALTDFELHMGDASFPVHKSILSARSPVFRAMFTSDMKESVSNSLDVPDLDVHTLNRLLTFLYGGTVEQQLLCESALKLYYAADKYQVQSLKQQCTSILRFNLSVSNVSDILTLADRHQDQELTAFVHEFILNKFDEIVQSKEWEIFLETHSYLAGKVMCQLYKKKLQTKGL